MVKILAVDPGTENTGFAEIIGDIDTGLARLGGFGVIRTSTRDGSVRERIDRIGDALKARLRTENATHFVIEDFTEQGRFVGKTYKEMAWLVEHLRTVGRELGIPTDLFKNAYWKKALIGINGASKNQVRHFLQHQLPETKVLLKGSPDHVWDSAAIGLCRFQLLRKAKTLQL